MNFNFKIKGFEVKVKDQADIRIDEIEVGYENVKLSEIPKIIKELRKIASDFKEQHQSPVYSQEEYPYTEDDRKPDPILAKASDDTNNDLFDEEEDDEEEGESNEDPRDADYDVKPQKPKSKKNGGKQELFAELAKMKTDSDMPRDFECLGNIGEVYPDLPDYVLEAYRVWIWESKDRNIRIATSDHGNSHLSFLCEGTKKALIKHIK